MPRLIFPAFLLILGGCASQIEYGRRSLNEPALPRNFVPPSLIVSATKTSEDTDKTPTKKSLGSTGSDLSLILFNPKSTEVATIKKLLEESSDTPQFNADQTVAKLNLVASVSKSDYRPADRFVNFRLRITPNNFSFTNYIGSATDYTTIDIEKLELTKSNSSSLKLTRGTPISTEIGLSNEKSLKETGDIATRIENLTVNIDDQTLDIYREAERGVDLAGNTVIKISATAKNDKSDIQILYDTVATDVKIQKDSKDIDPANASIKTSLLKHLQPQDLTGDISFDYVIRRVLNRSNEYSEHNQTVSIEVGSCKQKGARIIRTNDFSVPLWVLSDGAGVIEIGDNSGFRTLHFTDPVTATNFGDWMVRHRAKNIGKLFLRLPTVVSNTLENPSKYPKLKVVNTIENNNSIPKDKFSCSAVNYN